MGLSRRRSGSGTRDNQLNVSQSLDVDLIKEDVHTRKVSQSRAIDERWVWRACLVARLLNALLVRTYFNPDEHWQALEVAHRMVFGYGHLTWEWKRGIRSYVHPLLFAALYKVLAITGLDKPLFMIAITLISGVPCPTNTLQLVVLFVILLHLLHRLPTLISGVPCPTNTLQFVVLFVILLLLCIDCHNTDLVQRKAKAPRLLQAVFAAMCDLYLFKLTFRVFDRRPAYWALFCQMTNWFTFFCMTRTLSNSLETTLTVMALFYWPDGEESKRGCDGDWVSSRQVALMIAGLSCAIRPTNAIVWLYMGVVHLIQTPGKFRFLLAEVLPIGAGCLTIASFVDRWMYGHWTFVPLNFLKFNFLSQGGDFYGTHPWHWYFSQGFPVMVFTFLPLSAIGMWRAKNWLYAGLIGWVLSLYSVLGHKEFRFVLPVLPVTLMFAGYGLAALEQETNSKQDDSPAMKKGSGRSRAAGRIRWILFGLLLTNIPAALYTSTIHQRGGEAVIEYLAREAHHNRVDNVLFLMPCHSTPLYSSLHSNISMRFLDCSPSDEAGYVDEADQFHAQPLQFLSTMFSEGNEASSMPSHIVLFDSVERHVWAFLRKHSYKLDRKFFHAHFPVDRELQGFVLLYTRPRKS